MTPPTSPSNYFPVVDAFALYLLNSVSDHPVIGFPPAKKGILPFTGLACSHCMPNSLRTFEPTHTHCGTPVLLTRVPYRIGTTSDHKCCNIIILLT